MNREFPKFALGVLYGLLKAATNDIDVFLVMVGGLLLGGRRGLGKALFYYLTLRRADTYLKVWVKQTDKE